MYYLSDLQIMRKLREGIWELNKKQRDWKDWKAEKQAPLRYTKTK